MDRHGPTVSRAHTGQVAHDAQEDSMHRLLFSSLLLLSGSAFAAQGQIVDVNPSGVTMNIRSGDEAAEVYVDATDSSITVEATRGSAAGQGIIVDINPSTTVLYSPGGIVVIDNLSGGGLFIPNGASMARGALFGDPDFDALSAALEPGPGDPFKDESLSAEPGPGDPLDGEDVTGPGDPLEDIDITGPGDPLTDERLTGVEPGPGDPLTDEPLTESEPGPGDPITDER